MKKYIGLSFFTAVILFSGCSSRIDAVPVEDRGSVKCEKCSKTNIALCTYETRVVEYKSNGVCGETFPVTVRRFSDCPDGDSI
jgi:hypothetical protein